MMRLACAAPNCLMRTYDFSKEQDKLVKNNYAVTFHKLPLDVEHRSAWIAAAGKPDWTPSADSFLCSLHFGDNFFDQSSKLCDNAVPTIFFEDFRSHIKNLAKEIDLEINVESSDENEDILSRSLKSIGPLVSDDIDDGDQIIECEITISSDGPESDGGTCAPSHRAGRIFKENDFKVVRRRNKKYDEETQHRVNSATSALTSGSTIVTKTPKEKFVVNPKKLVSMPPARLKDTPKPSSTLPATNITLSTSTANSNDVMQKMSAMIQEDSLKESPLVEPVKKEFVFQLLRIVKMAYLQNTSTDSSVPNSYLITTRQEKSAEDQKSIPMETSEIISLVTGTVKMIKNGEFRKSDTVIIVCASPAIFLIKNVTVKNFDPLMNSVYVVTSDDLTQPIAAINEKNEKSRGVKSVKSNTSTAPTRPSKSSAEQHKLESSTSTTKKSVSSQIKPAIEQNTSQPLKQNSNASSFEPLKPKSTITTNSQNDTSASKNVKIDLKALKTDNSVVQQSLRNLNLTGVPTLLQNIGLPKQNVLKLNIASPFPSALVPGPNKPNVIRLNLASPIAVPKSAVYCDENAKTNESISNSGEPSTEKSETPAVKKAAVDPAQYLKNQQRDIERLEKDILYHEREIGLMKKRVQSLKKRYSTVKNPNETKSDEQVVEDILNKYLDQDAVQFFLSQMKVAGKTYTQFRWSEEDKLFALGLLYKHPVEYNILFQKFTLPSDKTLSKFVSKIKKAENKKP